MTDPRSKRLKPILLALGWVTLALTCAALLLAVGLIALWSFGAEFNPGSYLGTGLLMSAILFLLLAGMGYSVRAAVRVLHPRPETVRGCITVPLGIIGVLLFIYVVLAVRSFVSF